jgi:hypothetical protein
MRRQAKAQRWPSENDKGFSRWAEKIWMAVNAAQTFNDDRMTPTRAESKYVRAELKRMYELDDRNLTLVAHYCASVHVCEVIQKWLRKCPKRIREQDLSVRYHGACENWEPGMLTPTQLRYAIGLFLRSREYRGRPTTHHVDAVTDVVVEAHATLSGSPPTISRRHDSICGPLVDFAGEIGHLSKLAIAEENRLRKAARKFKKESVK